MENDKVALVTGASAGIGAAITEKLVKERRMRVVACARRLDLLKALKVSLGSEWVFAYKCDLIQVQEVAAMMKWIKMTFGRLDVVVNNAGVMNYGHMMEQCPRDWEVMVDLNFIAPSYITQLTWPVMPDEGGDIIFVNSMAGHVENDNAMTTFYNATKYGLTALIDCWRQEVKYKYTI